MRFYTPPQATNDPSYISYSKEPDRIKANTAVGDLFSNVGEVAGNAIKGADFLVNDSVKKEAQAGEDALYDAAISSASSNIQNGAPTSVTGPEKPNLPPNLQKETETVRNRIESLQSAVRAGKLPHIQFMMEREALSRDLRMRNPGYRETIDNVLGNTANSLYQSLQSEFANQQAKAQAGKDKIENQLIQKSEYIVRTFPDFFTNREKYKGQEMAVFTEASRIEARKKEIDETSAAIDLARKQGTPVAFDLVGKSEQNFTNSVGLEVNTQLLAQLNGMGYKDLNAFNEKLRQMRESGTVSEKDRVAITNLATTMEQQIALRVQQMATQPLRPGSDQTYLSILTAEKVRQITEAQLAPVRLLRDSLLNKETGFVNLIASTEAAKNDRFKAQMLNDFPYLRTIETLRQITGGGIAFDDWVNKSGALNSLVRDVQLPVQLGTAQSMSGVGSPTGSGIIDTMTKHLSAAEKPKATKVFFEGVQQRVSDPKQPDETVRNESKAIFGDTKLFARVSEAEKPDFLQKMASPAVTERQWKLGQTDPADWVRYRNWVQDAARQSVKQAADSVAGMQQGGSLGKDSPYQLVLNPATNLVEVQSTLPATMPGGVRGMAAGFERQLQRQVEPLNKALGALAPVLAKEKAVLPTDIQFALAGMGINVSSSKSPDQATPGPELDNAPGTLGTKKPSDRKAEGDISMKDVASTGDPLKDVIMKAEAPGGFNSVFGGSDPNLTKMTVDEVLARQPQATADGKRSTAAGGFQFMRETLAGLKKELGLKGDERFDETLQHRLADALLERRGLSKFKAGKMSMSDFADSLAQEWAGLPTRSGKSHYEGDGVNKAKVSRAELLHALEQLQRS